MNINEDIIFNLMQDWKKRKIDKWTRANILKQFLEDKNISQRELARRLDIPKSTIEDWMLYNKLSRIEYEEVIEGGYSETQIYRMLRDNKDKTSKQIFKDNMTDKILKDFLDSLIGITVKPIPPSSKYTSQLIQNVIKELNKLEFRIKK